MKKLVVLLLLTFLLITGCSSVEVTKVDDDINTDALKFSKEYPLVSEDNVFEYYTYDNLIDKIENGTGVIFLAYPTCKYCDLTASLLDGISKEKEIKLIQESLKENNLEIAEKIIIRNIVLNYLSEYLYQEQDKIITLPKTPSDKRKMYKI